MAHASDLSNVVLVGRDGAGRRSACCKRIFCEAVDVPVIRIGLLQNTTKEGKRKRGIQEQLTFL